MSNYHSVISDNSYQYSLVFIFLIFYNWLLVCRYLPMFFNGSRRICEGWEPSLIAMPFYRVICLHIVLLTFSERVCLGLHAPLNGDVLFTGLWKQYEEMKDILSVLYFYEQGTSLNACHHGVNSSCHQEVNGSNSLTKNAFKQLVHVIKV